jgi:fucose 4-O-acetylase-like acetyltransferase
VPSLRDQVLDASASRDRVSDAVKALALGLVILGHGLAWTTTASGTAVNTLEVAPWLFPLTWLLQILPLFFLVAGDRMRGVALDPSTDGVRRRVARLVTPTLPLLLVTIVAAAVIPLFADDAIASAAGVIPVQLLWFLGVYLAAIALCPVLVRIRRPWHFVAVLLAIGAVDLARVRLWESIGWVNLLLAWLFFVALGMQLPQLRQVRRGLLAATAIAGLSGAIALVVIGPYSAALISTDALPGISNLAPPTVVLVLVGIGQASVLLLAWPLLARLLARDSLWVPVAVFSSRAMGMYLLHMLFLAACIGVVLSAGLHPTPLSVAWWLLHAGVLGVAAGISWSLAPTLIKAGGRVAATSRRVLPRALIASAGGAPARTWLIIAGVSGLMLLLVSESGVGSALEIRVVKGIPYLPAAAVILLVIAAALAMSSPRNADTVAE